MAKLFEKNFENCLIKKIVPVLKNREPAILNRKFQLYYTGDLRLTTRGAA